MRPYTLMTAPADARGSPISRLDDTQGVDSESKETGPGFFTYLAPGVGLGIIFTKAEVISWFRIQEMFRFDSFHMYGIIGSAVAVAALSLFLIKKMRLTTVAGDEIQIPPKAFGRWASQYWIGGTFFGFGWALLGACPGPIFALIGNGFTVFILALASSVFGTWFYGLVRPHLPHD